MTRRYALIDVVARWRWFRRPASRRGVFLTAALVLALLTAFPRRYVAELQFTTGESGPAGLSALLGQLGGVIAGVANRQSIEQVLAVARSYTVREGVARAAGLADPGDADAMRRAVARLDRDASVRVQRGAILDVEVFGHDRARSLRIAEAYAGVVRERLAVLARASATQRRRYLAAQLGEAQARVTAAEQAVDRYRRTNGLLAPSEQLGSGIGRAVGLEGQLQAKQIQLDVARRAHADGSFEVRGIRAEIAAIGRQLAAARAAGPGSPATLSTRIYDYNRLTSELGLLQGEYQNIRRYLEAAALEETSADLNLQIVQPAYIETGFSPNTLPAVLLVLLLLLAVAAEFHQVKPPPGTPPALP